MAAKKRPTPTSRTRVQAREAPASAYGKEYFRTHYKPKLNVPTTTSTTKPSLQTQLGQALTGTTGATKRSTRTVRRTPKTTATRKK